MDSRAVFGCMIVTVLVIGGLLAMRAVSRAIFPIRVRLFEAAMDVVQDPSSHEDDRLFAEWLMDSARSFSAGWVVPQALVRTLGRIAGHGKRPKGTNDERVNRLIPLFIRSVLVANPVALFLSVPLSIALIVMSVVRHKRAKSAFSDETQRAACVRMHGCHT